MKGPLTLFYACVLVMTTARRELKVKVIGQGQCKKYALHEYLLRRPMSID